MCVSVFLLPFLSSFLFSLRRYRLQVNDIADAMIMKRLFSELFAQGYVPSSHGRIRGRIRKHGHQRHLVTLASLVAWSSQPPIGRLQSCIGMVRALLATRKVVVVCVYVCGVCVCVVCVWCVVYMLCVCYVCVVCICVMCVLCVCVCMCVRVNFFIIFFQMDIWIVAGINRHLFLPFIDLLTAYALVVCFLFFFSFFLFPLFLLIFEKRRLPCDAFVRSTTVHHIVTNPHPPKSHSHSAPHPATPAAAPVSTSPPSSSLHTPALDGRFALFCALVALCSHAEFLRRNRLSKGERSLISFPPFFLPLFFFLPFFLFLFFFVLAGGVIPSRGRKAGGLGILRAHQRGIVYLSSLWDRVPRRPRGSWTRSTIIYYQASEFLPIRRPTRNCTPTKKSGT